MQQHGEQLQTAAKCLTATKIQVELELSMLQHRHIQRNCTIGKCMQHWHHLGRHWRVMSVSHFCARMRLKHEICRVLFWFFLSSSELQETLALFFQLFHTHSLLILLETSISWLNLSLAQNYYCWVSQGTKSNRALQRISNQSQDNYSHSNSRACRAFKLWYPQLAIGMSLHGEVNV